MPGVTTHEERDFKGLTKALRKWRCAGVEPSPYANQWPRH